MLHGDCGAISGMNEWQGKPKYVEETYTSAALSTTNITELDPGSGRRSGSPPLTASATTRRCFSVNTNNSEEPFHL
jgi:hypothetical protein